MSLLGWIDIISYTHNHFSARSREADCETAVDPQHAALECSLPQARLCRQYQDQHCWHAAKVEEAKKPFSLAQLAMSLTDREILHIRQAGSWQEVIGKADRAMAMNFLLYLWETSRIKSWRTSWKYFRQYKQLYASATGRYMDRNDSREILRYLSSGRLYTAVVADSLQVA